jgi:hypothetical protein
MGGIKSLPFISTMKRHNIVKYSKESLELIELCEEDQRELKMLSKAYYDQVAKDKFSELSKNYQINSVKRTKQALRILDKIKEPTLVNIGEEASIALVVLVLHAKLVDMKIVMRAFKDSRDAIAVSVIPVLEDKILVFEGLEQKFGTQWMEGEDGRPFLYPVKDFNKINELRAKYNLGPIARPKIVSLKEDGSKLRAVTKEDQRMPTSKELKLFKGEFNYE